MKANEKKSKKKDIRNPIRDYGKKVDKTGGVKGAMANKGKEDLRAAFMENLRVKKMELEKTLERLMENQREYDSQLKAGEVIDEFDDAQREISASRYYALIERKIKELQKIELVIERIPKEKKFGICEECERPIPKERLSIIPEATLCVSCQQKLEQLGEQKDPLPRKSAYINGIEEVEWAKSGDLDAEGHVALKSSMDDFSVKDPEETETQDTL